MHGSFLGLSGTIPSPPNVAAPPRLDLAPMDSQSATTFTVGPRLTENHPIQPFCSGPFDQFTHPGF